MNKQLIQEQVPDIDIQSERGTLILKNGKFHPFESERNSLGKLMSKEKTRSQTASTNFNNQGFNFLRGQQKVLKSEHQQFKKKSTTFLVGLEDAKKQLQIIKSHSLHRLPLKASNAQADKFTITLQADQKFVKQIKEQKLTKRRKNTTQLSCPFLSTERSKYEKINHFPGPGVYPIQIVPESQPQGYLKMKSQLDRKVNIKEVCKADYYNNESALLKNKFQRTLLVPEFNKYIGRAEAFQNGIFAKLDQQERQQLQHREKQEDKNLFDDKYVEHQIELTKHFQKYTNLFTHPKSYELSIQQKSLHKPEIFHNQWGKMLEQYGFKKSRGRLYRNQQPSSVDIILRQQHQQ